MDESWQWIRPPRTGGFPGDVGDLDGGVGSAGRRWPGAGSGDGGGDRSRNGAAPRINGDAGMAMTGQDRQTRIPSAKATAIFGTQYSVTKKYQSAHNKRKKNPLIGWGEAKGGGKLAVMSGSPERPSRNTDGPSFGEKKHL